MKYTDAQIAEITVREKKALDILRGMDLTPSAVMQKVNLGNDIFADKVVPYLQDLRYAEKSQLSVLDQNDEPTKTTEETVDA